MKIIVHFSNAKQDWAEKPIVISNTGQFLGKILEVKNKEVTMEINEDIYKKITEDTPTSMGHKVKEEL